MTITSVGLERRGIGGLEEGFKITKVQRGRRISGVKVPIKL